MERMHKKKSQELRCVPTTSKRMPGIQIKQVCGRCATSVTVQCGVGRAQVDEIIDHVGHLLIPTQEN